MAEITKLIHKYLRHDKKFPHVFCPGCGIGIFLGSLIRAVDSCGFKKDEVVLVTGIGCTGRLAVYVDFNTLHTTHGRALAFATGIKLVKPNLKVIVVMGDGDAIAIGGNHFIHAARRNVDLKAVVVNNSVYGMTGGQYSPTTPYGAKTTTSPISHIERPFRISELAIVCGASFVARSTVYHVKLLDDLLKRSFLKKGFSLVEVISHCPTQYGRMNKMGSPVDMLIWQKEHAFPVEKEKEMNEEELKDKFPIGVLADRDFPLFEEEYEKLRKKLKDYRKA
jgi:2-oxoglutarate ferredoxin oxidoreductase subunit beta